MKGRRITSTAIWAFVVLLLLPVGIVTGPALASESPGIDPESNELPIEFSHADDGSLLEYYPMPLEETVVALSVFEAGPAQSSIEIDRDITPGVPLRIGEHPKFDELAAMEKPLMVGAIESIDNADDPRTLDVMDREAIVDLKGAYSSPEPDFIESVSFLVQGATTDLGLCYYPLGYLFGENEYAMETIDVLAHEPSCTKTVEVGIVERDDTVLDSYESADPGAGTDTVAQATQGFEARTRSQVREPAYPAMDATSEVWTWVRFYPTSGCVHLPGAPHNASTRALSSRLSWWSREQWVTDRHRACNVVWQKAHARFGTTVWPLELCSIQNPYTQAHHWPAYVEGLRGPNRWHSTNTSNAGTGSWLLRNNQYTDGRTIWR